MQYFHLVAIYKKNNRTSLSSPWRATTASKACNPSPPPSAKRGADSMAVHPRTATALSASSKNCKGVCFCRRAFLRQPPPRLLAIPRLPTIRPTRLKKTKPKLPFEPKKLVSVRESIEAILFSDDSLTYLFCI